MHRDKIHIFLDIDGVLATSNQYHSKKRHPKFDKYPFDKKCVNVFNEIVLMFNPIIILSSDWALHHSINEMNEIFEWNNLKCIITDTTRFLWKYEYHKMDELEICRATEILEYVEDYNLTKYIAIDDLNLKKWIDDNFIHTPRANEGIKQTHIKEKIIMKLNKFK